jgi:Beta propeller domain
VRQNVRQETKVLMTRAQVSWREWVGAGLLLGAAACGGVGAPSDPGSDKPRDRPRSDTDLRSSKTALQRAEDCPDLLTKIQEDAITKLDLVVAQRKDAIDEYLEGGGYAGGFAGGGVFGGVTPIGPGIAVDEGVAVGAPAPSRPVPGTSNAGASIGALGGAAVGGSAGGAAGTSSMSPVAPPVGQGPTFDAPSDADESAREPGADPIGASDTNTQVAGVDEADFVKLVDSGKGMFLLHGSSLRKLTTFPAEALSLATGELKVEGNASELFVTDAGKAVVFSQTWGYGHPPSGAARSPNYCTPGWCGGGESFTKITVADVSGDTPKAVREIYYRGDYISSRRYGDVVRVVLQSYNRHSGLFEPDIEWSDAWGRPYEREQIEEQLDQWRDRTAGAIQDTTLADWLPVIQEAKNGALVDVEPACGSYYVPQPGISEYGLTHVLSINVSDTNAAVGGVTVLGQASTVYSSLARLVLAQPDYRWLESGSNFGFVDQQRTTLHTFELDAAQTKYLASGWVSGHLPPHNPQFGIDVADDHTLRVATTGSVRANPQAQPGAEDFWQTKLENRVFTLRQSGEELSIVGRSENLGHVENGETIHSARFVGDRGYVVTFRRTDPLIVLDVATAESPKVLGEIEIPGFSQYMHPLDESHLITFGQSGSGGSQLQLFDVSNPKSIPQPKLLDLGQSWSELANNHKAFTFYAEQSLIALPISGNFFMSELGYYRPSAGLKVIQVDAQSGFTLLGSVDHSGLYQEQRCIVCDAGGGCYAACSMPIEVRRGHFVQGEDATYVYAISYGGVSVSDVDDLSKPIKTVVLPQPLTDGNPWYKTPGGGFEGGGFTMGGSSGVGGARPAGIAVAPSPVSTPAAPPVANPPSMLPVVDAGVVEADGGTDTKQP